MVRVVLGYRPRRSPWAPRSKRGEYLMKRTMSKAVLVCGRSALDGCATRVRATSIRKTYDRAAALDNRPGDAARWPL
jgi:hypothetical protein